MQLRSRVPTCGTNGLQGWGQGLASREKEARASGENGGRNSKGGLVASAREGLRVQQLGKTQPRGGGLRPGLKAHRAKTHLLCAHPPPPLGRSEETEQETHRREPSYTIGPHRPPQETSKQSTFPESHSPSPEFPLAVHQQTPQNPTRFHTSSRLVSEIP